MRFSLREKDSDFEILLQIWSYLDVRDGVDGVINISKLHKNSYIFCKKMVEEIGVTVAPGIDFDEEKGKSFIRLSYSCKKKELKKAIFLLKKWI